MTPQRSVSSSLDAAFGALSDATRRGVIRTLLVKPRRAGELADLVSMSPQALSRHLRTLRKAGLVVEESIEADARVRLYRISPNALTPVHAWLADAQGVWRRHQFPALKAHVERVPRVRKTKS